MSDAVCVAPVFVVIGDFATRLAANVSKWITELGYEAKLLDAATKWGKDIPLVVCESRQMLKRMGVLCPYEFIVERGDFIPVIDDNGNAISNPVDVLKCRLSALAVRYQEGVDEDAMRDWFSGLFRRYMYLDETVHGTSNLIDLENLEADKLLSAICNEKTDNLDARKFRARFLAAAEEEPLADSLRDLQGLLRVLFADEMKDVEEAIASKEALIDVFKRCRDSYDPSREELAGNGIRPAFPRPLGNRAQYATPTGKIDVLVIDDNPRDIIERIEKGKTNGAGLLRQKGLKICDELFNFQPLKVAADSKSNVFEVAKNAFDKLRKKGLSYDLVLVDLCLGDEIGGDLSGYRMIRFVKQFFPDVPVVVYSKFRDMDHIARAFERGARWFLVKGEEDKLPRHVLRMLRQSGWHREWEAAQRNFVPIFLPKPESDSSEFIRKFHRTDEWKYLTYKNLEFLPGRIISVKKMGGGISSAVTFKAVKGIKLDGAFLQSPVIVKIDDAHNAMMEYERYFRYVRPYISNQVGRVGEPARILNRKTASIVYSFAGHPDSDHTLDSLSNALATTMRYESSCDYERFRKAFDEVFDEILPCIHRITPSREFGNAESVDCHSGVVEPVEQKLSAYPNVSFNEFPVDEFVKSYVSRMQPWWTIEMGAGADFVSQPLYSEYIDKVERQSEGTWHCVFHGIFRDHDKYVIEAYDDEARLGWLTGLTADHVARYRHILSPGKTLWMKGWEEGCGESAYRGAWLRDKMADAPINALKLLDSNWCADKVQCCQAIMEMQDDLKTIAVDVGRRLKNAKESGELVRVHGCEFSSPVGIVHGDLNFGNIMLESRRQDPSADRPDERWRMTDVWLIDFARTRRDLITHDFNVAFTATLSLLVEKDLFDTDGAYYAALAKHFPALVRLSFTDSSKSLADVPDVLREMPRFAFVYRILRRIRFAALKAGVSHHMYLLTSALACAYTFKIFLNRKKYVETSAMLAAMKICYELLMKEMVIVDDEFKNKLKFKFNEVRAST